MRMVEHAWVRIAELKEEAALEEWQAAHPRLVWLLKTLRWLRIRWLNRVKEFRESERGKRLANLALEAQSSMLFGYLRCTRFFGCRPKRRRVMHLTTKQLIEELDRRALDRTECVERSDLLDALCGVCDSADVEDERDELVPLSPVDKMV